MQLTKSLMNRLGRRKQIDLIRRSQLDRCLNTFDLTALGIGATLGVGSYVLAGSVAKDIAGPSIVLSFLFAGFASALSGLCYAELGSKVPLAGSAYVYSYVTVGEAMGFVIGWNLVLEYAIGSASIARAYSGYLDSMFNGSMSSMLKSSLSMDTGGILASYPDLYALAITVIMTLVLSIGVKQSTRFNNVFTVLNLLVMTLVIFAGLFHVDFHNWNLSKNEVQHGSGGFFPFGFSGTLSGAATCFYGFVGFDSIATSGEESKSPATSIPTAIVISLAFVTLTYLGISCVVTLVIPYTLQDENAPLPHIFKAVGWDGVAHIVTIGALFGLSASLMGAMFPLPRIVYAMSSDGLLFRFLSKIHDRYQTPVRATLIAGAFSGIMTTLFDLRNLIDMMSIGTLMAYTLVSISVIILRYVDIPLVSDINHPRDNYFSLLDEKTRILSDEDDDDNDVNNYDDEEEEEVSIESLSNIKPKSAVFTFSQLGPQLLNLNSIPKPTSLSSYIATIAVTIYSILACMLVISFHFVHIISIVILLIFSFLCLVVIMSQPQTKSSRNGFKVPFVPFLPAISILINLYLMSKLSRATWIRFGVWMAMGLFIYAGYGWKNSSEEYRQKGRSVPHHK